MKALILAASALALIPGAAHAQLLGGGGLGGGLGGSIGGTLDTSTRGTITSTIDRTSQTVRGTVDGAANGTAATQGTQSVDTRRGTVSAERSASGSLTGSTASLADLVVPAMGSMAGASGSGSASGQGRANAQLIGTDAVTGTIAPTAQSAKGLAANAAASTSSTATGMIASAPMPSLPANGAINGSGTGTAMGEGSASLAGPVFAVAGSAAAAGEGVATVKRGMPVMTPDGASLGKVRQVVANGRGEVQQVIVKQGKVTRALPAGMFSASGNALVAGEAQGNAGAVNSERAPADGAAPQ